MYIHLSGEFACTSWFQRRNIDSDVTVHDYNGAVDGLKDVFIVHVAEIDVGCGVYPVSWIDELESHTMHIISDKTIVDMLPLNERLLHHYLEVALYSASKTKDGQPCFGEIGVVEWDAVECEDRLDKIIESDGFDKGGAMVIDFGFTALSYLFAKRMGKRLVYAVCPAIGEASPTLYAFSLLRSALEFSFEIVAIRCSSAICVSFCSRE